MIERILFASTYAGPRMAAALFLSFAVVVPLTAQPAATTIFVNTLMPQPASLTVKPGSLPIGASFSYKLPDSHGARLSQAAVRFVHDLEKQTGVQMALAPVTDASNATLTIDVRNAANEAFPTPDEDESYTLDVDATHIRLHANTDIGALRGITTLLQLAQPAGDVFVFPAIHIEDAPRFHWRGLMLDCGRHFLPLDVIYRTLDGMAAVKLNVLHWHLSEDQGFRIESHVYPKLQEMGSNGLYYTQQQVRDVIAYAAARGIRVVPEFDIPGHATSWMVGYPDLGSAPGPYSVETTFGVKDAAIDPTRETTYRFLDKFLGEMAGLFPDAYMHIGGDESNGKQWHANPHIQAFMKAHGFTTTQQLQTYFNNRVQKILAKYHKRMLGWDEILNPELPKDAIIQVWHGDEFVVNSAKQGHRELYSHPYYLDHMYTAAQMFLTDPVPANADLTPDQSKLILGGEACMWGEHISPDTVDSRIWPRAAVVAERLWSPATDRDTDDMYRRLAVESLRLDAAGLEHISGPERSLRQLAGTEDDRALKLFATTLQPVDFHVRYEEQHVTQLTPLDLLVDAVRPDPPLRHHLDKLVDRTLLGDTSATKELQSIFHAWVNAAPTLERLAAHSPRLQQASDRIGEWPKLGTAGLEALDHLTQATPASSNWLDAQKAFLKLAEQHKEMLDFAVLPAIEKLVSAAGTNKPSLPQPQAKQ